MSRLSPVGTSGTTSARRTLVRRAGFEGIHERQQFLPTPELERLAAFGNLPGHVAEFLEWLPTRGLEIVRFEGDSSSGIVRRVPWHPDNPDRAIAEFLGLDWDKMEKERRSIVEHVRQEKQQ